MTKKPLAALILFIHENAADAAMVRQAVAQEKDDLLRLQWVGLFPTALARLAGGGVDAILLDLAGDAALDRFSQLRQLAPRVPIVVMCGADDEALALRAMRAGAADYIRRQPASEGLGHVLRSAVERSRNARDADGGSKAESPKAGILAVLGAKGGVGATTVALNVASDLARRHKVILVEMRPLFGTLAQYFKPHGTIRNLSHLPAAPGAEQVQAYLWRYDGLPGLSLLFGPQAPAECREIAPGRAQAILTALAEMAEYVIVDLPASLSEANRQVLENSNYLALVAEPDPVCIHTAGQVGRAIQSWSGAPRSMGTVIVNRTLIASPMELEGIDEPLAVIPPEPDLCLRAQAAHTPLVAFLPESLMAKNLIALAARLEPVVRAAA